MWECERYECDINEAKSKLERYGVAIIKGVLDEKECESMKSGMWEFLNGVGDGIREDDPETWVKLQSMYPKHGMLIQNFKVGHNKFVWDIRQNEKVVNIFKELYKSEELLVSFDGVSISLEPEITNRGWNRKVGYHCDQSYLRDNFECIQGWVNGYDTNEGDATLGFYEGSHVMTKEVREKFNIKEKADWYKLNEEEKEYYKERCDEKRIKCPKGSLVLWDSRTVHSGVGPEKWRKEMNKRCCVYVSYMPKGLASEKMIKKRIKAYEEDRMTSHNAINIKLFPKNPRTYGGELPDVKFKRDELSELGRELVGYKKVNLKNI